MTDSEVSRTALGLRAKQDEEIQRELMTHFDQDDLKQLPKYIQDAKNKQKVRRPIYLLLIVVFMFSFFLVGGAILLNFNIDLPRANMEFVLSVLTVLVLIFFPTLAKYGLKHRKRKIADMTKEQKLKLYAELEAIKDLY